MIVKSTGDGVLAEFPSALDAVEWAQAVQVAVAEQRGTEGAEDLIALRIAIHIGEVVSGRSDIYGDGVNLAARLQEHAPPGGIILSETARELLRGTVGAAARDLGLLRLKNFEGPVRAYALDPPRPALAVPSRPSRRRCPRSRCCRSGISAAIRRTSTSPTASSRTSSCRSPACAS